jgi:hypothetical protein
VRLVWWLPLVLVLFVVAAALYFTQIPKQLASDYRKRAEPAQRELTRAMRQVYGSFSASVFGANPASFEAAKTYRQQVLAYDRLMRTELRQLRAARNSVERAGRAIARAPRDDLLEVPDWPLLGGRGKLGDVAQIADDERRYLRRARSFLREYGRLVAFHIAVAELDRVTSMTTYRALQPTNPTSAADAAAPLERIVRQLRPRLRSFRKRKPPPDAKRQHKLVVALEELRLAKEGEAARAVRALDFARARRAEEALARATRKYKDRTEDSVVRLLESSRIAHAMRDLRRRERTLLRALVGL